MVRKTPTFLNSALHAQQQASPSTLQHLPATQLTNGPKPKTSQSLEDSSMTDGLFHENNTFPPNEDRVLQLFSLKHKTAIISGADRGIGLAVANAFAEAGANVAIWYHSNEAAHDRARDIAKTYGVKCKAFKVDVTDDEQTRDAIRSITREFNGRLDIFVANAGIPWQDGGMIDGPLSSYHKVVATDLDGVFYCARAAGEIFRQQAATGVDMMGGELRNYRYGSFIATASMSGHIANIPQLQAAYNAAKAGVIHLCKSLAVEWVKFARVNSVSPGYMATEISNFIPPETKAIWHKKIPMGREGEAHELKGAYLYLASDASTYTTGTDIVVDGGYTSV